MTSVSPSHHASGNYKSMQDFGEIFIDALPRHIENLKIPSRVISDDNRRGAIAAKIAHVTELQAAVRDVLYHPTTVRAHHYAESTFQAFLGKSKVDNALLQFFNGWNETHKTTSLVSAKVIMRLSADAVSICGERQSEYTRILAHLHEVTKDDFGLGHEGHDGMYGFMTEAFSAAGWMDGAHMIPACNSFSEFLYATGVAQHKTAMDSFEYHSSIISAIMVSIASELWNGREYNFIAQYIEKKIIAINASVAADPKKLRNAKGYVMGHAGEVENRHGLHALAAAHAYSRMIEAPFEIDKLKAIMIDYNLRIGDAFQSLYVALTANDCNLENVNL